MKFSSTNEMSAISLIRKEGNLKLAKSIKTGKTFFIAGTKTGYASAKAVALFSDTSKPLAERLAGLKYAEVTREDQPDVVVPCLMTVGKPAQVIVEATVADLAKL